MTQWIELSPAKNAAKKVLLPDDIDRFVNPGPDVVSPKVVHKSV